MVLSGCGGRNSGGGTSFQVVQWRGRAGTGTAGNAEGAGSSCTRQSASFGSTGLNWSQSISLLGVLTPEGCLSREANANRDRRPVAVSSRGRLIWPGYIVRSLDGIVAVIVMGVLCEEVMDALPHSRSETVLGLKMAIGRRASIILSYAHLN